LRDIEDDVEILAAAGADFIALDGFGGGTGATELFVRETWEYHCRCTPKSRQTFKKNWQTKKKLA